MHLEILSNYMYTWWQGKRFTNGSYLQIMLFLCLLEEINTQLMYLLFDIKSFGALPRRCFNRILRKFRMFANWFCDLRLLFNWFCDLRLLFNWLCSDRRCDWIDINNGADKNLFQIKQKNVRFGLIVVRYRLGNHVCNIIFNISYFNVESYGYEHMHI